MERQGIDMTELREISTSPFSTILAATTHCAGLRLIDADVKGRERVVSANVLTRAPRGWLLPCAPPTTRLMTS